MGEDKTFRSEFAAAEAARRASAMEEARVRFESAAALATNDVEAAEALSLLGRVCGTLGRFADAERALREAMRHAAGTPRVLAAVRLNLGTVRWIHGDVRSARSVLEQARDDFRELGMQRDLARAQSALGIVLIMLGAYERAAESLQDAIDLYAALGDAEGVGINSGNLGECYLQLGALERAQELFERSLHQAEQIGKPQFVSDPLRNLGRVYAAMGDLDRALSAARQALELGTHYQRQYLRTQALAALADVHLQRGELAEARAAASELLALPGTSPSDRAEARLAMGGIELAEGDGTRALVTLQEGLLEAEAGQGLMLMLRYHVLLAHVRDHPAVARVHREAALQLVEQVAAGLTNRGLEQTFRESALVKAITGPWPT